VIVLKYLLNFTLCLVVLSTLLLSIIYRKKSELMKWNKEGVKLQQFMDSFNEDEKNAYEIS
jgi:hypothetical protein